MIRYKAKKWWSLKEADDGQYVAYHEYEKAVSFLYNETKNLWERIRQQREEIETLEDNIRQQREEITVLEDRVKRQKGAFEQYSSVVSKRMIKDEEYIESIVIRSKRYKAIALTFGVVIIILLVHAYI